MRKYLIVSLTAVIISFSAFAFENFNEAYQSGIEKSLAIGSLEHAREDFKKASALARRPDETSMALYQVGETYFYEGEFEKARETYGKIISHERTGASYLAQAHLRVADTYSSEKNYERAREEYERVLRMEGSVRNTRERRYASLPKVEARYKIGETYRAEANFAKAREHFSMIKEMEEATEQDKMEAKYRIKSIYR